MKPNYHISLYLDTRREKKNKKYPVKLNVFAEKPRKQKLYGTEFEFSKNEFESIWLTTKPRNEHKQTRKKMHAILEKAESVAEKLKPFTFKTFEEQLHVKEGAELLVDYQYKKYIEKMESLGRVGNADTYKYSRKSIETYTNTETEIPYDKLTFRNINKDWLESYETYMKANGKSSTTVGIYLRPLRALFKKVLNENLMEPDYYPFGILGA
jgi:integrase/recombinase XerD